LRDRLLQFALMLVLAFGFMPIHAQNLVDSLRKQLPFELKYSTPKENVDLLNKFAFELALRRPSNSEKYALHALQTAKENNYIEGAADSYHALGSIYLMLGDASQALELYQLSESIYDSIGNENQSARLRGGMADIYISVGDLKTAELLLTDILEVSQINDDYLTESINLRIKGSLLGKLGKNKEALKMLEKSLMLSELLKDSTGMSYAHIKLGEFYSDLNDYKVAKKHFIQAGIFLDIINNKIASIENLISLGKSLMKSGKYESAILHLKEGLRLSSLTQSKIKQVDIYKLLSESYKKSENIPDAFDSFQKHVALKDSIFNANNARELVKLRVEYNAEQKDSEMEQLKSNEEIQTLKIWFLIAFMTVGVVSFFFWRRQKHKAEKQLRDQYSKIERQTQLLKLRHEQIEEVNKQLTKAEKVIRSQNNELVSANSDLEEKVKQRTTELRNAVEDLTLTNSELDMLIYRTSHDLKSPLASLKGLSNLGIKESGNKITRLYFGKVKATAESMLQQLLKLSNIYTFKHYEKSSENVILVELVKKVVDNHQAIIKNCGVETSLQISSSTTFISDSHPLKVALGCLLENAIAFRRLNKPKVEFIYMEVENEIKISIKDNGIGIPDQYQAEIFDMFFRGSAHTGGGGLGLYVSSLAIEALDGKLELVSSDSEDGTEFCISLPK
jgi:signal transduction histidine kinase